MDHRCPSSNEAYTGRCPVTTCPFNLEEVQSEANCMAQIVEREDLAAVISPVFNLPYKSSKKMIDEQSERLVLMARAVSAATAIDPREHCPNCGYLRPCQSQSLCDGRKKTIDAVLEDIGHSLTAVQAWSLFVTTPIRFSRKKLDDAARQLIVQQDVKS